MGTGWEVGQEKAEKKEQGASKGFLEQSLALKSLEDPQNDGTKDYG